jgi:hypothetical protein
MKASELRIGNLTKQGPVTAIRSNDEFIVTHDSIYDYSSNAINIEPIPLTEERLTKFGLKKEPGLENGLFKWHRSAVYSLQGRWLYGILADDNNSYYHVSELEYVHQFQNLYFALTGKELNPTS